jgi:hypothetical protein
MGIGREDENGDVRVLMGKGKMQVRLRLCSLASAARLIREADWRLSIRIPHLLNVLTELELCFD